MCESWFPKDVLIMICRHLSLQEPVLASLVCKSVCEDPFIKHELKKHKQRMMFDAIRNTLTEMTIKIIDKDWQTTQLFCGMRSTHFSNRRCTHFPNSRKVTQLINKQQSTRIDISIESDKHDLWVWVCDLLDRNDEGFVLHKIEKQGDVLILNDL